MANAFQSIKRTVVNTYNNVSNWVVRNPARTAFMMTLAVALGLFIPGAILLPGAMMAGFYLGPFAMALAVTFGAGLAGVFREPMHRAIQDWFGVRNRTLLDVGTAAVFAVGACALMTAGFLSAPVFVAFGVLGFAVIAAGLVGGLVKLIKKCCGCLDDLRRSHDQYNEFAREHIQSQQQNRQPQTQGGNRHHSDAVMRPHLQARGSVPAGQENEQKDLNLYDLSSNNGNASNNRNALMPRPSSLPPTSSSSSSASASPSLRTAYN